MTSLLWSRPWEIDQVLDQLDTLYGVKRLGPAEWILGFSGAAHLEAVKRVLWYIKGSLDLGIHYVANKQTLAGIRGYSDSDWGSDVNTLRSTMGYLFKLAGGAISWSSCLQPQVVCAIALTQNPVFHARTKHLRMLEHFVREHVRNGEILVTYIPTHDMVADIFTKPLPRVIFQRHCDTIGVRRISGQEQGGVLK
ncbi:BZ3500_MvSof-1268-A1-R1_C063g00304 [Microbotryum saponariae]|uniref:BZ3500_MvSof-1268-A1-R1_C063g00304 protein n=1 Tax=Microbotryum saponariae TaxID=289078 RepID=A0A2X0KHN0_9BASI|nr:BZ3500_MvSof-1268-A1-R1_C063g00304 [Microbotryum saponariae]